MKKKEREHDRYVKVTPVELYTWGMCCILWTVCLVRYLDGFLSVERLMVYMFVVLGMMFIPYISKILTERA